MTDQDKKAILAKWESYQEDIRIEADVVAKYEIEAIEQRERAERAEAASATQTPCDWTYVRMDWVAACGNYRTMYVSSRFPFCPGCGHPVRALR